MRELKFRFWDKDMGKFTDYGAIHIDGDIMTRSATFGDLYDFVPEEMEKNIIVEQFTGLKDKNGVEIYEGDVLSYTGHGTSGMEYTVKYDDSLGGFSPFCNPYAFACADHGFDSVDSDDCVVIGNIHENPNGIIV